MNLPTVLLRRLLAFVLEEVAATAPANIIVDVKIPNFRMIQTTEDVTVANAVTHVLQILVNALPHHILVHTSVEAVVDMRKSRPMMIVTADVMVVIEFDICVCSDAGNALQCQTMR